MESFKKYLIALFCLERWRLMFINIYPLVGYDNISCILIF